MSSKDELEIRGGKGKSKDTALPIAGSYRATRNLPQAVMKISSYSKGASRAGAHLAYISRNGELELESPQGEKLRDHGDIKERLDEWAMDFGDRKNSRDTVNIVLSSPRGSDVEAVRAAVRDFAQKNFGQTNDYLFAIHDDTNNPHGHLAVKMRGYDGEKLNPGRKDLREWRASYAESLRAVGVEVDASRRSERGVGIKAVSQKIWNIKNNSERKGGSEIPESEKSLVKSVVEDLKQGKRQGDKPWAKASKAKTQKHKEKLESLAESVEEVGESKSDAKLTAIGKQIKRYAKSIPEPKTKAEVVEKAILERAATKDQDVER